MFLKKGEIIMPRASILLMKVFNNKFFCLAIFVISILFICCMDSVRASGDNLIENGWTLSGLLVITS
jgi:hypothetical protein